MIEPQDVAELAADAIEARITGDATTVVEALQRVLVEGTPKDALVFLVTCLWIIKCGHVPGMPVTLWILEISSTGRVQLLPGNDVLPGQLLFAELLEYQLADKPQFVGARWSMAPDEARSGAIGTAVSVAAATVKRQRAAMN